MWLRTRRSHVGSGEFYGGGRGWGRNFAGMEQDNKNKPTPAAQLWAALVVTALGCCLLIAGFIVEPPGEIHQSVLIGFGECLTFAGSLLGIDYRYRK